MVPFLEGQNLFGLCRWNTSMTSSACSGLNIRPPCCKSNLSTLVSSDKMIFSAIISTLSVEALPHVVGLTTSREVWLTLESLFSAQSQSRIMQLKQQLATLKKCAFTISAYYQKAQGFSHLLAAIGKPIEALELVSAILAGLGPEFDSLVTSVTTRQDSISLNEILFEIKLQTSI
jgi:hypothetical protein